MQHECIPQAILGMDVICQAKSGMGKTAVFVISSLQQLEPVDGQASAGQGARGRGGREQGGKRSEKHTLKLVCRAAPQLPSYTAGAPEQRPAAAAWPAARRPPRPPPARPCA